MWAQQNCQRKDGKPWLGFSCCYRGGSKANTGCARNELQFCYSHCCRCREERKGILLSKRSLCSSSIFDSDSVVVLRLLNSPCQCTANLWLLCLPLQKATLSDCPHSPSSWSSTGEIHCVYNAWVPFLFVDMKLLNPGRFSLHSSCKGSQSIFLQHSHYRALPNQISSWKSLREDCLYWANNFQGRKKRTISYSCKSIGLARGNIPKLLQLFLKASQCEIQK